MQSRLAFGLLVALTLSGWGRGRTSSSILHATAAKAREGRAEASSLYITGRYRDAERAYSASYRGALAGGDAEEALRCLNGLGGAQFALLKYREAMQSYLEARRLAQRLGRDDLLVGIHTNLSSLYLQQQDLNAGARAAEQALHALRRAGPVKSGSLARTQAAVLYARQGNMEAALPLFREALEESESRGDERTLGLIWDQLGYELLARGRLGEAEKTLLEGFRIRKLNGLSDLQYSYYTLGMLRLAQGDAATARRLLDEALARLSGAPVTLAVWRVYYERGRASMQMGLPGEALADFRTAVELARRVRIEVLPADSVWINTGVDQYQLYSALIRASASLFRDTGNGVYARLGFEAVEENRAAGLRALIFSPQEWRKRLPAEYWETLARLRGMESRLLRGDDSAARAEMSHAQYRLTEMEAEAGLSLFPRHQAASGSESGLIERVQSVLGDGEAYFSFHLDEPESHVWVLTRRELQAFTLPGRRRLASLAARFHAAVEQDLSERARLGRELYSLLFGPVPERLLAASRWSLALEGELYEVPMAALVTSAPGAPPEYLAQKRVMRMVPSALLLEPRSRGTWSGAFVGIGDPVYNAADERSGAGSLGDSLTALWRRGFSGGEELPRLPGSGGEIRACARVWGGEAGRSVVLTGPEASLRSLDRALEPGAAVVHFATHFTPSAAGAKQAMIALSLDGGGAPELLGPAEISRRRLDVGLVVLSGCASASAEAAPAEGLMGMTRAWLAAGARSVVATLWPTPDDQGQVLVSFYAHLMGLRDRQDGWAAAEALQGAQLHAMRSGTAYQSPAYWGAYILAGRE